MFERPSLIVRISVAKGIGFLIGIFFFILLPLFVPNASLMVRWGVFLWYITLGGIIGISGFLTWHPVLRLHISWWIRGPFLGGWMNFILTLICYELFEEMIITIFGSNVWIISPFLSVAEGAIFGLLIDYAATRLGGEGEVVTNSSLRE